MIFGLGTDLLNINRIEKLYQKYKDTFVKRILSNEEIQEFNIKPENKKINYLAKRFSGKEAFSKALGLGIGRGINFNDISILNNSLGKPEIFCNKKSVAFLEKFLKNSIKNINNFISFSDEDNFIFCTVIIVIEKGSYVL